MLAAILLASVVLLVTTTVGEARSAPSWLSRLVRAVIGRSEERVAATASDTIVVFGPKLLSLGAATSGTFVERFTTTSQTGGFVLRVTNGPGGVSGVTSGTVSLNGAVVVTSADLAALASGTWRDVPVLVAATDTIVASLTGPANAAISVSLLAMPDPTFIVFGPRQYERARGAPVTVTEHFTLPAGAKSPAYLCVRNGEPDGTRRNSASTVTLNGVQVVGQSNLNQQVAGLHRQRGGWHDHALAHQDWRTSQSAERWRIAAR